MTNIFACSHCQKSIRAPADAAGRGARCPHCQGTVRVPRSSDELGDDFDDFLRSESTPSPPPPPQYLPGRGSTSDDWPPHNGEFNSAAPARRSVPHAFSAIGLCVKLTRCFGAILLSIAALQTLGLLYAITDVVRLEKFYGYPVPAVQVAWMAIGINFLTVLVFYGVTLASFMIAALAEGFAKIVRYYEFR